ncbi:MAG: hypothetical protein P1U37_07460 [Minwuia sp.]|nr:hypothetical protein [Minwuia sp.]
MERNILHPAERLEQALGDENKPHFVHWESELLDRRGPYLPQDIDDFSSSLNALRDQVEGLIKTLETDVDQGIKSTDEFRFSIVFDALHDLHEFFPDFPLSRGNWDPELREMIGIVPEFVRRIFLETTGEHEQLDSPIKIAIDDIRKSRTKSN